MKFINKYGMVILRLKMQLSYTFWEAKEGGYIGFLNQYPDYWTQGDDIAELEKMLASLYGDIIQLKSKIFWRKK